jgi:hypothetical protein
MFKAPIFLLTAPGSLTATEKSRKKTRLPGKDLGIDTVGQWRVTFFTCGYPSVN